MSYPKAAKVGSSPSRIIRASKALFYEEFLPPETLFYSLLIAQPARRKAHAMSAAGVVDWLAALDLRTIQIGGGETIGKGLCAVLIARAAELQA